MLASAIALIALATPTIEIHRAWTVITGDNTQIAGSKNGVIYYCSETGIGAIREADGAVLWTRHNGESFGGTALIGDRLLAWEEGSTDCKLASYPLDKDRNPTYATTGQGFLACVPTESGLLTFDRLGIVSSYDKDLKKILSFGTGIKVGEDAFDATLLQEGKTLVIGVEGSGFTAVDMSTHQRLWNKADKYPALYQCETSEGLLLLQGERDGVFDLRTGVPKWSFKGDLEWRCQSNGVLIAEIDDQIQGLDWKSGKVLWKASGGSEGSIYAMGRSLVSPGPDGNSFVVEAGSKEFSVGWYSLDGRLLGGLNQSGFFDANDERWLFSDGERILGFLPGKRAPLPTDASARKEFALKQVMDFELLGDEEREELVQLREFATQPLLRRYSEWANHPRDDGKSKEDGLGLFRYGLVDGLWPLLDRMVRKEDTEVLLQTLKGTGFGNWWTERQLLDLVQRRGDEALFVPFVLEHLRSTESLPPPKTRGDSTHEIIAQSKHPDAVKFFLDALGNPKARDDWRSCAFEHLAGTGGEEGVAAVRAAFPQSKLLKPWHELINVEAHSKDNDAKIAKDAKGRTWMLFYSAALGNGTDPFIVERTPTGWDAPLFLGFSTRKTWDKAPPSKVHGIPLAKLLATEWVKVFPEDAGIRLDSDKDGLTNLVEKRLGTNPNLRDTDKDGMLDSVDPCPNAAPRPLGDKEKIIQAVLAARFFEEDWGAPALFLASGVKPFQIVGYGRVLIWGTHWKNSALGDAYGGGVNLISFGSSEPSEQEIEWLKIAPDGKSAKTLIRRASGGLNGDGIAADLIKVDDDWFVVELNMVYVS